MKVIQLGSGVVGQPTGEAFMKRSEGSIEVTFVDVSQQKLCELAALGYTAVTPDVMSLDDVDAVFVSLPTPSLPSGAVDFSYLDQGAHDLGRALLAIGDRDYPVVVFRSTQLPGTTQRCVEIIEDVSGKKAGIHFGVVYNPEYLRAETAAEDALNPKVVTIGHATGDCRSIEVLQKLFAVFPGVKFNFLTYEEAEFQKYCHNVFNAAKISFFNEMRLVAAALGIDPERAIAITADTAEGCTNPVYGTKNRGAYDGVCLPKDTNGLDVFTSGLGIETPMVAATRRVNHLMGGR